MCYLLLSGPAGQILISRGCLVCWRNKKSRPLAFSIVQLPLSAAADDDYTNNQ